jgi:hypothetical protein
MSIRDERAPYSCTRATVRSGLTSVQTSNAPDQEELSVQLIELPRGKESKEVALAICAAVLGNRGAVSVVGRDLVVVDFADRVVRARALVQALQSSDTSAANK